jgi:type IV secretory pathway VirB2 component (pilin)
MCSTCAVRTTKAPFAGQWFSLAPVDRGSGQANTARTLRENTNTSKKEIRMNRCCRNRIRLKQTARNLCVIAVSLLVASPVFAQTGKSPWENAVGVLQQAFTSTIARGLSLVAIVVAGLTFAFGEGGSKRILAGVLFGVGMAIASVNFLSWLFP